MEDARTNRDDRLHSGPLMGGLCEPLWSLFFSFALKRLRTGRASEKFHTSLASSRYHLSVRVTAFITALSFLATSIPVDHAWAAVPTAGPSSVGSSIAGNPGSIRDLRVDTFELPAELGVVKDSYDAIDVSTPRRGLQADKGLARGEYESLPSVVIHIQDAHCNYACQNSISALIDYLAKTYGIKTVNLEGGADAYDLSLFTKIKDKELRAKVSDYFVREGMVNGAESFAINNPDKVTLWGVEDVELYRKNLAVYRDSLNEKKAADEALGELGRALNALKIRVYSKDLLDLDAKRSQYKSGALDFKDYLASLLRTAEAKSISLKGFPDILLFTQLTGIESKIDFKKADSERALIIDQLDKRLPRAMRDEFVQKTVAFKMGAVSARSFYEYIMEKARFVNIDITAYPELAKYIEYNNLYERIDKTKMIDELSGFEKVIKNALFENTAQRELDNLSCNLSMLKSMFGISMVKNEYRYYKEHKKDFEARIFADFIKKYGAQYGVEVVPEERIAVIDTYRKHIEKFFTYSMERDEVFVKAVIARSDAEGSATKQSLRRTGAALRKSTILITGGFHSENLADLFKKKGISYISIMPSFKNDESVQCPYFKLLGGETPAIEKQLTMKRSSLALFSHFCKASGVVNGAMDAEQLAAWEALIEAVYAKDLPAGPVSGYAIVSTDSALPEGAEVVAELNGRRVIAEKITSPIRFGHIRGSVINSDLYSDVAVNGPKREEKVFRLIPSLIYNTVSFLMTAGFVLSSTVLSREIFASLFLMIMIPAVPILYIVQAVIFTKSHTQILKSDSIIFSIPTWQRPTMEDKKSLFKHGLWFGLPYFIVISIENVLLGFFGYVAMKTGFETIPFCFQFGIFGFVSALSWIGIGASYFISTELHRDSNQRALVEAARRRNRLFYYIAPSTLRTFIGAGLFSGLAAAAYSSLHAAPVSAAVRDGVAVVAQAAPQSVFDVVLGWCLGATAVMGIIISIIMMGYFMCKYFFGTSLYIQEEDSNVLDADRVLSRGEHLDLLKLNPRMIRNRPLREVENLIALRFWGDELGKIAERSQSGSEFNILDIGAGEATALKEFLHDAATWNEIRRGRGLPEVNIIPYAFELDSIKSDAAHIDNESFTHTKSSFPGIRWQFGETAEKLPLEWGNMFSFIMMVRSLEYHYDPLRSIEEVYRVLKPGGEARIALALSNKKEYEYLKTLSPDDRDYDLFLGQMYVEDSAIIRAIRELKEQGYDIDIFVTKGAGTREGAVLKEFDQSAFENTFWRGTREFPYKTFVIRVAKRSDDPGPLKFNYITERVGDIIHCRLRPSTQAPAVSGIVPRHAVLSKNQARISTIRTFIGAGLFSGLAAAAYSSLHAAPVSAAVRDGVAVVAQAAPQSVFAMMPGWGWAVGAAVGIALGVVVAVLIKNWSRAENADTESGEGKIEPSPLAVSGRGDAGFATSKYPQTIFEFALFWTLADYILLLFHFVREAHGVFSFMPLDWYVVGGVIWIVYSRAVYLKHRSLVDAPEENRTSSTAAMTASILKDRAKQFAGSLSLNTIKRWVVDGACVQPLWFTPQDEGVAIQLTRKQLKALLRYKGELVLRRYAGREEYKIFTPDTFGDIEFIRVEGSANEVSMYMVDLSFSKKVSKFAYDMSRVSGKPLWRKLWPGVEGIITFAMWHYHRWGFLSIIVIMPCIHMLWLFHLSIFTVSMLVVSTIGLVVYVPALIIDSIYYVNNEDSLNNQGAARDRYMDNLEEQKMLASSWAAISGDSELIEETVAPRTRSFAEALLEKYIDAYLKQREGLARTYRNYGPALDRFKSITAEYKKDLPDAEVEKIFITELAKARLRYLYENVFGESPLAFSNSRLVSPLPFIRVEFFRGFGITKLINVQRDYSHLMRLFYGKEALIIAEREKGKEFYQDIPFDLKTISFWPVLSKIIRFIYGIRLWKNPMVIAAFIIQMLYVSYYFSFLAIPRAILVDFLGILCVPLIFAIVVQPYLTFVLISANRHARQAIRSHEYSSPDTLVREAMDYKNMEKGRSGRFSQIRNLPLKSIFAAIMLVIVGGFLIYGRHNPEIDPRADAIHSVVSTDVGRSDEKKIPHYEIRGDSEDTRFFSLASFKDITNNSMAGREAYPDDEDHNAVTDEDTRVAPLTVVALPAAPFSLPAFKPHGVSLVTGKECAPYIISCEKDESGRTATVNCEWGVISLDKTEQDAYLEIGPKEKEILRAELMAGGPKELTFNKKLGLIESYARKNIKYTNNFWWSVYWALPHDSFIDHFLGRNENRVSRALFNLLRGRDGKVGMQCSGMALFGVMAERALDLPSRGVEGYLDADEDHILTSNEFHAATQVYNSRMQTWVDLDLTRYVKSDLEKTPLWWDRLFSFLFRYKLVVLGFVAASIAYLWMYHKVGKTATAGGEAGEMAASGLRESDRIAFNDIMQKARHFAEKQDVYDKTADPLLKAQLSKEFINEFIPFTLDAREHILDLYKWGFIELIPIENLASQPKGTLLLCLSGMDIFNGRWWEHIIKRRRQNMVITGVPADVHAISLGSASFQNMSAGYYALRLSEKKNVPPAGSGFGFHSGIAGLRSIAIVLAAILFHAPPAVAQTPGALARMGTVNAAHGLFAAVPGWGWAAGAAVGIALGVAVAVLIKNWWRAKNADVESSKKELSAVTNFLTGKSPELNARTAKGILAASALLSDEGSGCKNIFGTNGVLRQTDTRAVKKFIREQEALKRASRRRFEYLIDHGPWFTYRLVRYDGNSDIGRRLAECGIAGACNLQVKNRAGNLVRYVLLQDVLDAGDKAHALEHEELEIYWLAKMHTDAAKEKLHQCEFTAARAAHILAWADQIYRHGWKDVDEVPFIKAQLDKMGQDDLDWIIRQKREDHERLIREFGSVFMCDALRFFEKAVKLYAYKRELTFPLPRGQAGRGPSILRSFIIFIVALAGLFSANAPAFGSAFDAALAASVPAIIKTAASTGMGGPAARLIPQIALTETDHEALKARILSCIGEKSYKYYSDMLKKGKPEDYKSDIDIDSLITTVKDFINALPEDVLATYQELAMATGMPAEFFAMLEFIETRGAAILEPDKPEKLQSGKLAVGPFQVTQQGINQFNQYMDKLRTQIEEGEMSDDGIVRKGIFCEEDKRTWEIIKRLGLAADTNINFERAVSDAKFNRIIGAALWMTDYEYFISRQVVKNQTKKDKKSGKAWKFVRRPSGEINGFDAVDAAFAAYNCSREECIRAYEARGPLATTYQTGKYSNYRSALPGETEIYLVKKVIAEVLFTHPEIERAFTMALARASLPKDTIVAQDVSSTSVAPEQAIEMPANTAPVEAASVEAVSVQVVKPVLVEETIMQALRHLATSPIVWAGCFGALVFTWGALELIWQRVLYLSGSASGFFMQVLVAGVGKLRRGGSASKDLGGTKATKETGDGAIRAAIERQDGSAVKVSLKAHADGSFEFYMPAYVENYTGLSVSEREAAEEKGKEVLREALLTPEQMTRLKDYIAKHLAGSTIDPDSITIGIIRDQALVNPAPDIPDGFSIVHAGTRTIWFGEYLLQDLLKANTPITDDSLLGRILAHDLLHITDNDAALAEHDTDSQSEYAYLVGKVRACADTLIKARMAEDGALAIAYIGTEKDILKKSFVIKIYTDIGMMDEAQILLDEMCVLAEAIEDDWQKSSALREIAKAYAALNDPLRVAVILEKALTAAEAIKDDSQKSLALQEIAKACPALNDPLRVAVILEKALTAAEAIENDWYKSLALQEITKAYAALNDTLRAAEILKKALTAAEAIKDDSEKSSALQKIAKAYAALNDPLRVAVILEKALTAAEAIKYDSEKFSALQEIAKACPALNDPLRAAEILEKALTAAEAIKDDWQKSSALQEIAKAYDALNDPLRAAEILEKALTAAEAIKDDSQKSSALQEIAKACPALNNPARAAAILKKVLTAAEAIKNDWQKSSALREIAKACPALNDPLRAAEILKKALTAAEVIEDDSQKSSALQEIAKAYHYIAKDVREVFIERTNLISAFCNACRSEMPRFPRRGCLKFLFSCRKIGRVQNLTVSPGELFRGSYQKFVNEFSEKNAVCDERRQIDSEAFFAAHAGTIFCLLTANEDGGTKLLRHLLTLDPVKTQDFCNAIGDTITDRRVMTLFGRIAALDQFNPEFYQRALILASELIKAEGKDTLEKFIDNHTKTSLEIFMRQLGIAVLNALAQEVGVTDAHITEDISSDWYLPYISRLITARKTIGTKGQEYYDLFMAVLKTAFEGTFDTFIHTINQNNVLGKDIAIHNQNVGKAAKDAGYAYDAWTGYHVKTPFEVVSKTVQRDYREDIGLISVNITTLMACIEAGTHEKKEAHALAIEHALTQMHLCLDHGKIMKVNGRRSDDPYACAQAFREGHEWLYKVLDSISTRAYGQDSSAAGAKIREAILHLKQNIDNLCKQETARPASFTIRRMDKSRLGYSLFMGDFVQCCMAMNSDLYPYEMLTHLIDDGIQIVEVIDDNTGLPIALTWDFLATDAKGNRYLVLDNFEINDSYVAIRDEVRDALIAYNTAYAEAINAPNLLAGTSTYTKVPLSKETRPFTLTKVGGYATEKPYYLEALALGNYYVLGEDLKHEPVSAPSKDLGGTKATKETGDADQVRILPFIDEEGNIDQVLPASYQPRYRGDGSMTALIDAAKKYCASGIRDAVLLAGDLAIQALNRIAYDSHGASPSIDVSGLGAVMAEFDKIAYDDTGSIKSLADFLGINTAVTSANMHELRERMRDVNDLTEQTELSVRVMKHQPGYSDIFNMAQPLMARLQICKMKNAQLFERKDYNSLVARLMCDYAGSVFGLIHERISERKKGVYDKALPTVSISETVGWRRALYEAVSLREDDKFKAILDSDKRLRELYDNISSYITEKLMCFYSKDITLTRFNLKEAVAGVMERIKARQDLPRELLDRVHIKYTPPDEDLMVAANRVLFEEAISTLILNSCQVALERREEEYAERGMPLTLEDISLDLHIILKHEQDGAMTFQAIEYNDDVGGVSDPMLLEETYPGSGRQRITLINTSRKKKDTGFGLAFVYQVARIHGGSFSITNIGGKPGEGIVASLRIPARTASAPVVSTVPKNLFTRDDLAQIIREADTAIVPAFGVLTEIAPRAPPVTRQQIIDVFVDMWQDEFTAINPDERPVLANFMMHTIRHSLSVAHFINMVIDELAEERKTDLPNDADAVREIMIAAVFHDVGKYANGLIISSGRQFKDEAERHLFVDPHVTIMRPPQNADSPDTFHKLIDAMERKGIYTGDRAAQDRIQKMIYEHYRRLDEKRQEKNGYLLSICDDLLGRTDTGREHKPRFGNPADVINGTRRQIAEETAMAKAVQDPFYGEIADAVSSLAEREISDNNDFAVLLYKNAYPEWAVNDGLSSLGLSVSQRETISELLARNKALDTEGVRAMVAAYASDAEARAEIERVLRYIDGVYTAASQVMAHTRPAQGERYVFQPISKELCGFDETILHRVAQNVWKHVRDRLDGDEYQCGNIALTFYNGTLEDLDVKMKAKGAPLTMHNTFAFIDGNINTENTLTASELYRSIKASALTMRQVAPAGGGYIALGGQVVLALGLIDLNQEGAPQTDDYFKSILTLMDRLSAPGKGTFAASGVARDDFLAALKDGRWSISLPAIEKIDINGTMHDFMTAELAAVTSL